MPKVSVVVPAYNAESTIVSCVNSIAVQTETNIEIIVVDDGSTDSTFALLEEIARNDLRITIVSQPNGGSADARMKGTNLCKGEWVSFVDADDCLPHDAIELLLKKANEKTDIVFGHGDSLAGEERESISIKDFRHMVVRAYGCIGVPWGCLFRREIVSSNPVSTILLSTLIAVPRNIVVGEDYIFWLRLAFKTDKPVAIVYGNVYNKGADNISSKFKWTADYANELDTMRLDTIPKDVFCEYSHDVMADRIANLFAVAIDQPRSKWVHSVFYNKIKKDAKAWNYPLPLRQRLFLKFPSRLLRKFYSFLSENLT